MDPKSFVNLFTDANSKLGPLCVLFEFCYTSMVVSITIHVLDHASQNEENPIDMDGALCKHWESVEVQLSTPGETINAYVCTGIEQESTVSSGVKFAAMILFMIYLVVNYMELLIFNSFRAKFYETNGGKFIFLALFWSNLIQTVCCASFGNVEILDIYI